MTTTQDPDTPTADDDLNDAERALLKAACTGMIVDLQTGDEDLDNPANAANWSDDRKVRADFLAGLLTGDQPTESGRLRYVKLCGARITGTLDLEARKLLCPVLLRGCYFEEAVNLDEAEAVSIRLPGCHVPRLNANQLRTIGNMQLDGGFTAKGEIRLIGAHIGGRLHFDGASLTNDNGPALTAARLTVDGDMFCSDGFTAQGETSLGLAHIGGELDFDGASLTNDNGPALSATSITVDGSMSCGAGFTARGETRLICAHISGDLDLGDAGLTNDNGPALMAIRITVDGSMSSSGGFAAQGGIRLSGAHISGDLDLSDASLTNDNGPALNADGLIVDQSMFCRDGFTAHGEIRMISAHIGGQLNFSGASLTSNDRPALTAPNLTVKQDMFCSNGFTAHGEILLFRAYIGGHLHFDGASLINDNGLALNAGNLTTGQDMFCDYGFTAKGKINLTNAKVETFYDDRDSWPDKLWIRGFTYKGLGNWSVGTHARLQWLRLHDEPFTPQIYDQLADVYRWAGDDNAARKILITKQWRRRKPYNPLSWLWWVTVGYGYRTWQAFIWAAVLTVVGALVFSGAYPAHVVKLTAHPPRFQPVIYALDVLLPIGGLGQKSAWQPTGGYLDWYWGLAIAGWVLSAAVVAGLTGILKRD